MCLQAALGNLFGLLGDMYMLLQGGKKAQCDLPLTGAEPNTSWPFVLAWRETLISKGTRFPAEPQPMSQYILSDKPYCKEILLSACSHEYPGIRLIGVPSYLLLMGLPSIR